ncbi:hypothetical protein BD410DRAFT_819170 [Rickenella mellea]|uniref:Glycoside hydrolase n=1 Tax=Rickenella mellea TaxID=50990 RepID=A0A4Y7QII1_9AGAM|nr:hypothetical protein BD410DRAFT_819170 [Rickenella mellea]
MRPAIALYLVTYAVGVVGQTWCGKNYMLGSPMAPPGGQFPLPTTTNQPLLAFRCAPAIKPYLASDKSGSIIVDTGLTHLKVEGAVPFYAKSNSTLAVSVTVNGCLLASGSVPVNATGLELPFSLSSLKPQKGPLTISCTAISEDDFNFKAISELKFMPDPTEGSVTKMDLRTGALMVQSNGGRGSTWEPIFPIGFYTGFDNYLAANLSVINNLKARGFTVIHPIPTFGNLTALNEVLDRMEEVGIFLMYDMRFSYMNNTAVTEQVNMIKSRKNLLLWYTGDEPDGTSDPLNSTTISYDLINELDGYHPVSLVLNCQDYQFTAYTRGTDIVMQDTYPIDINATFSAVYHTPCASDCGVCGCDNCKGNFDDISSRMEEFKWRLDVLGDKRNKPVWAVPQAFGGEEFWPRTPTGNEFLVQSVLSINHGALGIVPWDDPTPADVKESATQLALAMPAINKFLFDPHSTFGPVNTNGVDIGIWKSGSQTLLLATNLNYAPTTVTIGDVFAITSNEILNSGGSVQMDSNGQLHISLDSVGTVGFVL